MGFFERKEEQCKRCQQAAPVLQAPGGGLLRRLIPRQAASCLAQYLAGALNQGRQSLDQLLLHSRGDSLLLSWEI